MSTKQKLSAKSYVNERANFKQLLAKNPNYFGSLAHSKFKVEKAIAGNTYYEELDCVGYNPELNELYATFLQKQESGYRSNLCGPGSREYVSFFVNYGSGWLEQGCAAINVHNIKTGKDCKNDPEKPLCFTASVPLKDVKRRFCRTEVLPRVRAILSWEVPVKNPDRKPVWGNVMECQIQLKPYVINIPQLENMDYIAQFLEAATNSPHLSANQISTILNENQEKAKSLHDYTPEAASLTKLATAYSTKNGYTVEPPRFSLPFVTPLLESPTEEFNAFYDLANTVFGEEFDPSTIIEALNNTEANTDYEELESLGLDYNREFLTATYKIKRQYGYSGNLCNKGSKEYVAFWLDFGDDCKWEFVGQTAVKAHDLKENDRKGICYTAVLPFNFDRFRQRCQKPQVIRMRAVLSWAIPNSTTNPDALSYYGNRLDTHIQIKPKPAVPINPGTFTIMGGIPVNYINPFNGLTTPGAHFAINDIPVKAGSPFGGRVVLQGPSIPGKKYRVQVRPIGSSTWTNVVTNMMLTGYNPLTGAVFHTFASADAANYFDYQPDHRNINNVLAWWDTTGNGLWQVKLDVLGEPGVFIRTIRLNHQKPLGAISIDKPGQPGAGECADYKPGDTIKGHFVAQSPFLLRYRLYSSVPGTSIVPGTGTMNTTSSPGNTWSLGLPAGTTNCGYFVALRVEDKTIINSTSVGFEVYDNAGFCVRD
ncbi:MAG: hypothetical protein MI974_18860 [Chitinophagales bacterium]|nr:hypothetical protein [Chitinophagales bacterium]